MLAQTTNSLAFYPYFTLCFMSCTNNCALHMHTKRGHAAYRRLVVQCPDCLIEQHLLPAVICFYLKREWKKYFKKPQATVCMLTHVQKGREKNEECWTACFQLAWNLHDTDGYKHICHLHYLNSHLPSWMFKGLPNVMM